MKKLIQISLVIVVTFALVFGLFMYPDNGLLAAGSCRVGWNTRTGSCLADSIWLPGSGYTPNVGWNSKASTMPSQDHTLAYCKFCYYPDVGWNG